MKSYGVTIQMKATEQYFPMVLFIMLYKVVLTFESADEILRYDHTFSVEHFFWSNFHFDHSLGERKGNKRTTVWSKYKRYQRKADSSMRLT